MKKDLIQFKGLYGDNQSVFLPNFIHHEPLETRSKMYDWEIKDHLHIDLFQLFIITEGEGIIVSENKEFQLISPCIITIPTNTIHGFIFQPNVKGEVITFSESFLENIFKASPKILIEIMKFKQLSFDENTDLFEQIIFHKNQFLKELLEENPEKQTVVQLQFQLFFIQLYRFSISQSSSIDSSDNRTLRYFQEFQRSIKQSITETKPINVYAKELNITAVHLNRVCNALVQKSALQIVHEYLIAESKKYLVNTNYSISEVSYLLNFKDPAYFTRLFKKQTGVSPSEFRKN